MRKISSTHTHLLHLLLGISGSSAAATAAAGGASRLFAVSFFFFFLHGAPLNPCDLIDCFSRLLAADPPSVDAAVVDLPLDHHRASKHKLELPSASDPAASETAGRSREAANSHARV
ncbi:hypothetical protein L596_010083 [Steinernema carpocapsae]|uniref:Secreted protein n=1 Tax=Steinernema carpocapsae TaxID=34508 RepID=A0A4U5PHK1_STECR|nr:hypothetical protein L596_010083 [Steinernema carpocapsae]